MFSPHVLFVDEKIPNRQTDYFREIDEMAVKLTPDEKHLEEYKYLVNTHHIDDKDELFYRVNRVVVRKSVIEQKVGRIDYQDESVTEQRDGQACRRYRGLFQGTIRICKGVSIS